MGLPLAIVRQIVDRKLTFDVSKIKTIQVPEKTSNKILSGFIKSTVPAIKYQALKNNLKIQTSYGNNLRVTSTDGNSVVLKSGNMDQQLLGLLGKRQNKSIKVYLSK